MKQESSCLADFTIASLPCTMRASFAVLLLLLGLVALSEQQSEPISLTTTTTTTTTMTTTETPKVLKKVCDVCNCTEEIIDCSNRKLETNLEEHEWPKGPIKLISFENNAIVRVKPFPNITVAQLTLHNNKIENIERQSFKWLKNLTLLDLSQNKLNYENFMPHALEGRFAPEAYEPLDKLKILNLSGNEFHSLNRDLFEHVEDLKTLILSNNPFLVFDQSSTIAISSLPYLEELDLSLCTLKNLADSTLHTVRYLKKLNISYNEFTKLPDALRDSPSLETLILDGNPIEMLGRKNSFPVMPKLKELNLCHMPELLSIDRAAMSNLEALEIVRIENCTLLGEIDADAFAKPNDVGGTTWPALKTLNISSNALRYLPGNLLVRWDRLEELHLMNNQWACDCDNQYLIGTLLPQHGKRLMGAEAALLTCASPIEHQNKSLAELAGRQLRCQDMYGARPERDAAVLVGMLVGVLLAVPAVLVLFILWRRGFIFCGAQGPASFSRAFYRRAPPYDENV
ncbi:leucine-rich repeat-containing protein 4B isoform X2 [Nasonia vitripennis]|uniref:Leucine-rich repeat neuronal protein 2 n=1 Tax=Nasonia vitripennis TaxID=7425 RepID=A0A7M7IUU8_NASVI|nr:leucine-rich repeat-containing protein 4B isoform X2 [Nasonia vitripennis]